MTYLADLGGIIDLLHTVFGRLSGFFTGKLLTAALISAAYRVQSTFASKKSKQGGISM